eukprot:5461099-Prymnesium_polylepis.2
MKAEQEKRAVVIRAEGESESASLVSLATHNHLVNCPIHIGTPDIRIARLPVFQLHKPGHRILRVCQQALDLLNNIRKDEFNVKGLKLLFRNQLRHQGVTENFVNFYDFSLLQQHQKNSERIATDDDVVDDNSNSYRCFIVPKNLLAGGDHTTPLINFKNIIVASRNLYEEVTTGLWRGFDDMRRSHPLYVAADEGGLWNHDDWSDPDYVIRQYNFITNMRNTFKPSNTIIWPRPSDFECPSDWKSDFYHGHDSIFVNAEENFNAFDVFRTKQAAKRADELRQNYDIDDEDESGHDEFEKDSTIEDDIGVMGGRADRDPFEVYVHATYGVIEDKKKCPCCKLSYSTELRRPVCGTCFPTVDFDFKEALQT